MNNKKLLTVGVLPLMWFLYFLFELFTGRIKNETYFLSEFTSISFKINF